ncbi:HrpE/YscL family type III secretion apparatus protein [Duganella sp. BJB488]|uniref:type III secretion system stator protein SctL n=1 Tax=unclassified Duganella TaxID=2636909 RepID=UPI000E3527E0|nr:MULTISPECIES: type III secretion system stator protein SctL [unclassified Duganella]RFP09343.1 HrpE/YscL family type III secretion apparatus protein [Duganella sp. BJB475]RFP13231.1 HrpE/YscL family type III secretion apparatus protein [Duganella sp. BJB489]RFP17194.1 HrpE/YscL family type III secretion apparatus protein [Duganella sp. BJB488]RFP25379.1 HrpE/YscL family type III secretion apparatus protein [Duganella sp. BJB476]RFP31586.1 HrpE/YscL family type III secretion apparatus protei
MVIWLRGEGGVGIQAGADVVRREDLARLSDIEHGFVDLQEVGARWLAEAHGEAAAVRAAAEEEARQVLEAAQLQFERSARLGYASGRRQAADALHAEMLARVGDDRRALLCMRERLAGIVLRAVERITMDEDRAGLFRRAAAQLGRALEEASFLTVSVHPQDGPAARAAFAEAARQMDWPVVAEVLDDAAASPGDCRCEWDYGVFDASLSIQLRAVQAAVRLALAGGQHEAGADDALEHGAA